MERGELWNMLKMGQREVEKHEQHEHVEWTEQELASMRPPQVRMHRMRTNIVIWVIDKTI
jgi:hypothetical protein